MASFSYGNVIRKKKLQQELQFYTNLVSNHAKNLQTSIGVSTNQSSLKNKFENRILLGTSSGSSKHPLASGPFLPQSRASNIHQRCTTQTKLKTCMKSTLFTQSRTSVSKLSVTSMNKKLPTVYKKVNDNRRIVILSPQNKLKSDKIDQTFKLNASSEKPENLEQALIKSREVFAKIGSLKHINELNNLTKELSKRKERKSLSKKTSPFHKKFKIIENNKLAATCSRASELESLKLKMKNLTKLLSSSKSINKQSLDIPTSLNSTKKAKIIREKISESSFQSAQVVKSPLRSLSQISAAFKKANLLNKSYNVKVSNSITKENFTKSKQSTNYITKSPSVLPKNSPRLSSKIGGRRLSSTRKQINTTKIVSSKYKVVNKNLLNPVVNSVLSSQTQFSKFKPTGPSKFIKRDSPSVRKISFQRKKLNSNFKVINYVKSPKTALKRSSINKLSMLNKPAVSNSLKISSSNYKLVNVIKTPKQLSNSLLKAPASRSSSKGEKSCKKRKLSITGFTPSLQNQNKQFCMVTTSTPVLQPKSLHKPNQSDTIRVVRKSLKVLSKTNIKRKQINSKYKVVNRSSPSKMLLKSTRTAHGDVRRTKSGVDIDLLLELAATEKELEEEDGRKPSTKKPILLKRVYKTKNAIVNHNTSSSNGKMAKMIKAKYSLSKRHSWHRQSVAKTSIKHKHNKGNFFNAASHGVHIKAFYSPRLNRNHFKSASQPQEYRRQVFPSHKGSLNFNWQRKHSKLLTRNQVKSTPISKVLASRVLHRSINRVLTASVKKEMSKVNKYCMFYNRFGRCNKGLKCTYIHDPRKIAVCTRFLRGTCKNEKCFFSHEVNPGKMAICSFFLQGSCTKTDCPYRHETLSPDAQLCKAFVQGYCPKGKQCIKAHILVCPKHIQGLCDKGNACAFPHPPQKEKKVLIQPVEQKETPTEDDLMESVSRYFQPANDCNREAGETVVVPKRQMLPEQPSFIAL